MNSLFSKTVKLGLCIMLVLSLYVAPFAPVLRVRAQGMSVPNNMILDSSPTSVSRTKDTLMLQVKNYVLDGLAYTVAKIVLQQLTASVVNWINSGFNGSPSFLTNPESFFTNTADQITGAFIANTGVLAGLCSPFSVDIRLALSLEASVGTGANGRYPREHYSCTLSSVIQNAQKSSINVSGSVSYNGKNIASGGVSANGSGQASVQGFTNGDFSQGGWPAFLAMTLEPKNNIYGAYLSAQDDLRAQISTKQNSIKADISLGRGFMSWQKCKDVPIDQPDAQGTDLGGDPGSTATVDQPDAQGTDLGGDPGSTASVDPQSGAVKYQTCETQTPGSVIAGSIDKALGIPSDTLNLADSLNEIVGALFSQLISQVLSGGLHHASAAGSNSTAGVVKQILKQSETDQLKKSRDELTTAVNSYYSDSSHYVDLRQQAVNAISGSDTAFTTALVCFNSKVGQSSQFSFATAPNSQTNYIPDQINAIQIAIGTVRTTLVGYQSKLAEANARLGNVHDLLNMIDSASTVAQIQQVSDTFNASIQGQSSASGGSFATISDVQNAQTDLDSAKTKADQFAKDAAQYLLACNTYSATTGALTQ